MELPYVHILNRLLPADIRVLSWAPVGVDFNARFSCLYRTYKYFFPRGTMDVEVCVYVYMHVHAYLCVCAHVCVYDVCMCVCVRASVRACVCVYVTPRGLCLWYVYIYYIFKQRLQVAVGKFVGEHDFRNFCKVLCTVPLFSVVPSEMHV